MKNIFYFITLFVLISCGKSSDCGKFHHPTDPINKEKEGYIPVTRAIIKISNSDNYVYHNFLNKINPISAVYAASTNTTVTYVQSETGVMAIDVSSLVPTNNGDVLDLGSLTITNIQVNKLKICGVGGNEKCGTAVVRMYTQDLVGFDGIDGFVNTTDSYGVPVNAGKGSATESVGLTSINAAIVQSYTIPSNDNKLNLSDFPSPTYVVQSDFSNAGAGNYEMTLIVEIALAL